jgi:polyisoprenoid-binding protein YceI
MKLKSLIALALATCSGTIFAQVYNIDPNHTYPSFEADHMGISVWRGKFNKTTGKVILDRATKTGALEIFIDATTIDFGHQKMNEHARGKQLFNADEYPVITYKGKSIRFEGDKPVAVEGDLTLLGVTRPVALTINKFKCITHPFFKREVCGADVTAEFRRTDFGMTYGTPMFASEVKLAIQVEALVAE